MAGIREDLLHHPQVTPPQIHFPTWVQHYQFQKCSRCDCVQLTLEDGEHQTHLGDIPKNALPDCVALVLLQPALYEEQHCLVKGGNGQGQRGIAQDNIG